jgi:hypothetical protein
MPETRIVEALHDRIQEIQRDSGASAIAAALYDAATREEFASDGDRWFHAASTIKVPVLKGTIPHRVVGKQGAGKVLLKPAAPGTAVAAAPGTDRDPVGAGLAGAAFVSPQERPRARTHRMPGSRPRALLRGVFWRNSLIFKAKP